MTSRNTLILSSFVLLTVLGDKTALAKEIIPRLYEEIGCKKIPGSNGPTRFECPTYEDDKCYFKGKVFNASSEIDENLWPSCQPLCRCVNFDEKPAQIVCAHNDCPEFFGIPLHPPCVRLYNNVKDCCRSTLCDEAKIAKFGKCVFDGEEYRFGQKIYPKDSCYHCLCAEGFNNQTSFDENPHCEKFECNSEIYESHKIRSGCTAVYRNTPSCCPIDFKCPADEDSIDASTATEFSNDERYSCKFGNLTLQHGQQLKTNDKCLKCSCSTPPFITCVKYDNC